MPETREPTKSDSDMCSRCGNFLENCTCVDKSPEAFEAGRRPSTGEEQVEIEDDLIPGLEKALREIATELADLNQDREANADRIEELEALEAEHRELLGFFKEAQGIE